MGQIIFNPQETFRKRSQQILSMYNNANEILKSKSVVKTEEELEFEKSDENDDVVKSEEITEVTNNSDLKEEEIVKSEDVNDIQKSLDLLNSKFDSNISSENKSE